MGIFRTPKYFYNLNYSFNETMPTLTFKKINILPLKEWKESAMDKLTPEEKNILEWKMFDEISTSDEPHEKMQFWKLILNRTHLNRPLLYQDLQIFA